MAKIKKRRLKKNAKIVIAALAAGLLLAAGCFIFFSNRRTYATEGVFLDEAYGVRINTMLIDEGAINRPGVKREIRYIVIHETDNFSSSANAFNHALYLVDNSDQRVNGWHYTVDDKEIYHSIPDDEVAWHAGDQRKENGGNMTGIAIELCVNEGSDFEQTLLNGAKLTAALCKEYNLTIKDVKQHYDFSQKDCPAKIRKDGRWEEFLELVKKYMEE